MMLAMYSLTAQRTGEETRRLGPVHIRRRPSRRLALCDVKSHGGQSSKEIMLHLLIPARAQTGTIRIFFVKSMRTHVFGVFWVGTDVFVMQTGVLPGAGSDCE